MTCLEWGRQIAALREGKLRLVAPGEDGLSLYARGHLDDPREYLKALEHGYRSVCETLDGYRKRERVRPALRAGDKSLQELVENQWSEGACLGYAAIAMRGAGFTPADTVRVLEAMAEAMELYTLSQAAEAHQAILEDRIEEDDDGTG